MDTEKPKIQLSYSLTVPALPLTLIVIYYRGKKNDDLDPVEVVSQTMPVLALRASDATNYPDFDGSVDPIVLFEGWTISARDAKSLEYQSEGYQMGRRHVCLTANVEQERADLEADQKLQMLDRDAWVLARIPKKRRAP